MTYTVNTQPIEGVREAAMKTNRPLGRLGFIMAAAVALSAAVVMTACGKLQSENVPTSAPSLSLEVTNAEKDSEGRYSVRANGKDTIEVVATVTGLSSNVGFYLPATWGTFTGGTLSATDGYTYYTADREGKARATFQSLDPTAVTLQPTGRIELVARSLDVEQSLPLSFEFAFLTVFPSTLTITDPSAPSVYLYARGGLPPIEWFSSNPRVLDYHVVDDTTIEVYVIDAAAFSTAGSVTMTARDAEGQTASSLITLGGVAACSASALTVNPPSGTNADVYDYILSVMVVDYSQAGSPSVTVDVGGTAPASTMTLAEWGSAGVFQANFNATVGISEYITFSYSGIDAACQPTQNTATFDGQP